MKITQDVRDYAKENNMHEEAALSEGMAAKSEEFKLKGSELYL
jgi:phosphomethylpyrimidine synthase